MVLVSRSTELGWQAKAGRRRLVRLDKAEQAVKAGSARPALTLLCITAFKSKATMSALSPGGTFELACGKLLSIQVVRPVTPAVGMLDRR